MAELSINPEPTGAAAPESQAPATERPAWLPEGFDTPEALATAFNELKAGKQEAQDDAEPNPDNAAPANPDEAVSQFVKDTGFDPVELSREIAAKGDISADAKTALAAKLKKAGLPASMIDEYITGQKAVMNAGVREVKSIAGGDEGWNAMAEWAGQNLSEAELGAFNKIMTTADINTAKLTVGNLYARYQNEAHIPGRRIKGGTGKNAGDIFRSIQQQVEAQKDPRYAKDPAYRAEVEAKIERTWNAGGYQNLTR